MSNRNEDETATGIALETEDSLTKTTDELDTTVDADQAEAMVKGLQNASKALGDLVGDLNQMKKGKLPF